MQSMSGGREEVGNVSGGGELLGLGLFSPVSSDAFPPPTLSALPWEAKEKSTCDFLEIAKASLLGKKSEHELYIKGLIASSSIVLIST